MLDYRQILIRYRFVRECEVEQVVLPRWQYVDQYNRNNANFCFSVFTDYSSTTGSVAPVSAFFSRSVFFDRSELDARLLPVTFAGEEDFLNEFLYLRKSSFVNFFVNNMVDVPVCFKKSKSLHNRGFELPVLKFSNFLMRAGKREKIVRTLFQAVRALLLSLRSDKLVLRKGTCSWLDLYRLTACALRFRCGSDATDKAIALRAFLRSGYGTSFNSYSRFYSDNFFLKNYLLSRLSGVSPVFSYFIYSVDKNVRKFSRGKSGKYTFVWKYVAPYKRQILAMRWVAKDVKFYQSKSVSDRLIKVLSGLTDSPEKSFAWKSKIFAHNYVFRNFRKSLMSTLRTTA